MSLRTSPKDWYQSKDGLSPKDAKVYERDACLVIEKIIEEFVAMQTRYNPQPKKWLHLENDIPFQLAPGFNPRHAMLTDELKNHRANIKPASKFAKYLSSCEFHHIRVPHRACRHITHQLSWSRNTKSPKQPSETPPSPVQKNFFTHCSANSLLAIKQTGSVPEYLATWQQALAAFPEAIIERNTMLLTFIINGLKPRYKWVHVGFCTSIDN
ncbi:hypothetical protein DSO57_1010395 [Entomophthora muscae]|uniref:Uncharacterized protein n=1 Tax=Entomophthora muscae TaxID=34485 RepID=A0ACC2RLM1_9FUNG|nr:hypothetical protein DSO57_1010395 [Entomophthora muscae]